MKQIITTLILLVTIQVFSQSKVSFTFDDGALGNRPNYTFDEWNGMLLKKLKDANIEAMLFVTGNDKTGAKGKKLLEGWNNDGHKIANHTFSHSNYSAITTTIADFESDFIKNDKVIESYSNYSRFFRFPYLKEGNTKEKVDAFRSFLKSRNYKNGFVTIDASDWYIDSRLVKRLRDNPNADKSDFREFYLSHIWRRAQFYEKLSLELNGRHIKHTLLLHHNLAAALFIDDLIKMFKDKGWEIVSATVAYEDPVYKTETNFAGESLIYALAKDSGQYKDILRYPAEGSRYEKEKMDELGL
ncbi:polysaccharide deacetylase family protein [Maribacter polysaccharolyticus]|uniref:polysaccharide deacetylase family protein n=1 Tax=Maribacter polysaccharolyticus TaxID=3020831 RepID=UPI00237F7181|nr:polysaccharide deacetylase family protein [Maribacter polysaccharolyticus]MDE3741112.1 polysaccharide deacetylase family protein [Maribacter polysaccharolyticus]